MDGNDFLSRGWTAGYVPCSPWAQHTGSLCGCVKSSPFPSLLLIHPSLSHSAWAGLRGKSDLFCRGEFLGEIVKPATVWAFISVERRRGRKERRDGQEGDRGESQRRVWTQTALLSSSPKEQGGGGEKGKSPEENETSRKTEKSSLDYVTRVILLLCLCFALLLLIRSLHLAPCTPALQVNNKLLPSPSPFFAQFSPSTLHYMHSINWGTKRDVWGRSRYYRSSFYITVILHHIANTHLNHNQ